MKTKGLLVVSALLAACGPSPVSPERGPVSGGYPVTVTHEALEGLEAPYSAKVGGIAALDVERLDGHSFRLVLQGAPSAGEARIVVSGRGVSREAGAFFYEAPKEKVFERVVAFGASLTMGSQDVTIVRRGQQMGPMAQLSRAAGAYLPLPLIKPGIFPGLTLDDFDRGSCRPLRDDVFSIIQERAGDMLPKLKDANGNIVVARSRVDPDVEVRNVAIGGFKMRQVLEGGGDLLTMGIEHMVWNPYVSTEGLFSEPEEKMIDRVVALKPTLIVSTDLFGNDYNNVSVFPEGVPDLTPLTPLDAFRPQLAEILRRLDETGAQVFLATGPDATVLPQYDEKIRKLRAAGVPEPEASAWRDAIRTRIGEYNAELRAQVAAYPRVHLVDLHAAVQEVLQNGVVVDGARLDSQPMGGLLSLDGMHFSDTGYALVANMFLEAINRELGTRVPLVDLAAVHANDPYSVEALRAVGFPCAGTVGQ
jgi:lysophospholipase L1-like esterase